MFAVRQSSRGQSRISVLKKVTTAEERGQVSDHAAWMRVPAGLPGGLSLIAKKATAEALEKQNAEYMARIQNTEAATDNN